MKTNTKRIAADCCSLTMFTIDLHQEGKLSHLLLDNDDLDRLIAQLEGMRQMSEREIIETLERHGL